MEPESTKVLPHVFLLLSLLHPLFWLQKWLSDSVASSTTTTYFLLSASSSPPKCEGQKASNGTKVSSTHTSDKTHPFPTVLNGWMSKVSLFPNNPSVSSISSHADSNSFQSMVISGQQANRYIWERGEERLGRGDSGCVCVCVCVEEGLLLSMDTFFTNGLSGTGVK
jgi:hypothetical protein